MIGDIRVCFIGDSFVQGVGDPEHRGWVGRVLEATGGDVTAFNLGIRRNTSEDVLRRCRLEMLPRTLPGGDNRLVVSVGSNDTMHEDGTVRVDPARSVGNVASILDDCRRDAISPLVVGPPPVVDAGEEHLRRTAELADAMAALCRARHVPFIATTLELAGDPIWTREAMAGDGAHPGSAGYRRLAELVLAGQWHDWITRAHSPVRPSGSSPGTPTQR
ncbi:GDSL-type esterase/lipase family protein [Streptomyces sp. B1I3]|uniref:GDSL-type esterase/lipase family protein n=1 Tax=Streptomyces sp. B1I3 TaxID=3042264 RepID=UPI002783988F|nr:GDSL-type esterase/lipase family protein [Streptomyces sp. B1I3]MDQ0792267.1 acyl-CoA thioesterase-1 [Streptomyces sp. B1I3]